MTSFFFYDLETSGRDPRRSRIMQFAGQRTDENLKPIGKPYNYLIKLTDDILPDPEAILVTGITPQKTIQEGISEAEFCKIFSEEIVQPNTCFVGYNNVRFDDEFMRFLLYRNFYDPYAWQWKDGNSRWDLLDVVRMTRALRPEGIQWPYDEKGVCTNRLELVSKINGLDHDKAHDALNDVKATLAVADMIKTKQPKLFSYLYSVRNKKAAAKLVLSGQPFIYTSGRFPSEFEKTTVVVSLGMHPTSQGALVYDLRHDPNPFLKMNVSELTDIWQYNPDKEAIKLPVKSLQFNRTPAIAPLGVLDDDSSVRLQIDKELIDVNLQKLQSDKSFYERLVEAVQQMNLERDKKAALHFKANQSSTKADEKLYDSFISDTDRKVADKVVSSDPADLNQFVDDFKDPRLKELIFLYKGRNYPNSLSDEERQKWEVHRQEVLLSGGTSSSLAQLGVLLSELSQTRTSEHEQYLLEELRLYAESIVPET